MKTTRLVMDKLLMGLCVLAVCVAIVPLALILIDVGAKGLARFDLDFFTQLPPLPNGKAPGGLGDAIQGTLIMVATASAIGLPVGLLSGVYISEYGDNWYGSTIRFLGDVLAGVSSIVTGILIYTLIVIPFHGFSMTAGAIALGSIMIPIVSNTSSQALKAVPNSIREASTALGVGKWRTTVVILANAKRNVATASLLAIARITGETAPIIMTAGISIYWFSGPNQPIATLTWYIYYYAINPYHNWQELAWTAALVLLIIVLGINIAMRAITRSKKVYA